TRSYGDWSSDVCSSDLFRRRGALDEAHIDSLATGIFAGHRLIEHIRIMVVGSLLLIPLPLELKNSRLRIHHVARFGLKVGEAAQIGRASCRERRGCLCG